MSGAFFTLRNNTHFVLHSKVCGFLYYENIQLGFYLNDR